MWIVGYGSLMHKKEFSSSQIRLVVVKGWMRVFNKRASRERWRKLVNGKYCATLTLVPSLPSSFNAVAYEIEDDQFDRLIRREQDYHTERVEVFDFETEQPCGVATVFVADEGVLYDDPTVLPITEYLDICREGAYSWGEDFGLAFEKTTFLADLKTSLK